MNIRFLLYFACFFPAAAFAQPQRQDLSSDMPFFQTHAQEYQKWLDMKGFGKALKLEKVQFKKRKDGTTDHSEIELLLLLTATDVDSAAGQWDQLKREFDTPSDSLESYLYRTFTHKMEIPDEQGNIQVYVRNKSGDYIPCFYVWIWSENGQIVSQKKVGICKARTLDVPIPPIRPNMSGRGQSAKISKSSSNGKPIPQTANQVFNTILKFVRDSMLNQPRYKTELTDRHPYVTDSIRNNDVFTFTVADLGKEVLTKQSRYIWEKYVNLNTIAMERLEFTWTYQRTTSNTFNLHCSIEGKYGSGIFKPRTSGYMNMENDFDDYFLTYKNKLQGALLNYFQSH